MDEKNAPETVFIQKYVNREGEECIDDFWYEYRDFEDDIEYIRKDLYEKLQEEYKQFAQLVAERARQWEIEARALSSGDYRELVQMMQDSFSG